MHFNTWLLRSKSQTGGSTLQSVSMLVLSLALSWKALEAYSGTLAVLGTVAYVFFDSLLFVSISLLQTELECTFLIMQ